MSKSPKSKKSPNKNVKDKNVLVDVFSNNVYNYHQSLSNRLNENNKYLEKKNMINYNKDKIIKWFCGLNFETRLKICSIYNDLNTVALKEKENFEYIDKLINTFNKRGTYKNMEFLAIKTIVVALINLTEELINEGLARETVSKIQQIRKNNNFDIGRNKYN